MIVAIACTSRGTEKKRVYGCVRDRGRGRERGKDHSDSKSRSGNSSKHRCGEVSTGTRVVNIGVVRSALVPEIE